jgi:hypothetical protein
MSAAAGGGSGKWADIIVESWERSPNSPHLEASGRSSEFATREERKAHYRRKATLETKKEATRRAWWLKHFGGMGEKHWQEMEAVRKTRKQHQRNVRKAGKAATRKESASSPRTPEAFRPPSSPGSPKRKTKKSSAAFSKK